MSDENELKPCGRCGGIKLGVHPAIAYAYLGSSYSHMVAVHCRTCDTDGPAKSSRELAISAHNTRTADPVKMELAEALRRLEFTSTRTTDCGCVYDCCCPSCGAIDPAEDSESKGHRPTCKLSAALANHDAELNEGNENAE